MRTLPPSSQPFGFNFSSKSIFLRITSRKPSRIGPNLRTAVLFHDSIRRLYHIYGEKMRLGIIIPGVIVALMLASLALLTNAAITNAQTTMTPEIQTQKPNGTILRTVGIGTVRYTPDQATISIGVIGRASTASEALRIASEKISKVIESLEQIGIDRDDMETTGINVYPQYDWNVQPPLIVGYEATYTLMATIRDIDKVGRAIDAAVKGGADNVWGVMFNLSEEARLRLHEAAIKLALEDAKAKAKIIAEELGLDEIEVLEINLQTSYPYRLEPRPIVVKETAGEVPIIPGEGQITVSIHVTFLLK